MLNRRKASEGGLKLMKINSTSACFSSPRRQRTPVLLLLYFNFGVALTEIMKFLGRIQKKFHSYEKFSEIFFSDISISSPSA